MKITQQTVHEAYCEKIKQQTGLDIAKKVDIDLDLARIRFLPPYNYIFWDTVKDFENEQERITPYNNMYAELISLCNSLQQEAPEGTRHNVYKQNVAKAAKITNNKHAIIKHLPTLGLPLEERSQLVNWSGEKITPKTVKEKTECTINTQAQPIDTEALPLPFKSLPKLVKTLIKDLPKEWQAPATMCLLPPLSTACG